MRNKRHVHNLYNTTYLIVVTFGEEQGTKLAVQCCLVGLVAMFG